MKNVKNNNVIWFLDEIYHQDFMVVFAPTHDKFRGIVLDELGIEIEPEEADGQFYGMYCPHGQHSIAIIWSSNKGGNLIHECFHACSWVLRNRNINLLSDDADEAYAYYLTYIWQAIKDRMKLKN